MPLPKMPNIPRALLEALSSRGGLDPLQQALPGMEDAAAITSGTRMLDGIRERIPPYEPDAVDTYDRLDALELAPGGQQRLPWDANNAQVNDARIATGGPEDHGAMDRRVARDEEAYEGAPWGGQLHEGSEELDMADLHGAAGDPALGALAEPLQPNLPGIPRAQASGDELATKMESLPTEGPDAPSSLTALITRLEEMLGRRLSDDEYRLLLKQQPQPGTSAPTPDLPF